jgi:hypothetical protein
MQAQPNGFVKIFFWSGLFFFAISLRSLRLRVKKKFSRKDAKDAKEEEVLSDLNAC